MPEPSAHRSERVLIVEDDPATRSGLTELVRAWGFTAESASDGIEALARVTAFRPSIIVSDLVMPRMSGLDLLKALKTDTEHIKVVLLTAQGTVDTAVEAVKAGAEDYLTKPLDPHKLRRLLERLAEIAQQKRENQALRRQLSERGRFGRIIGHSQAMRALYQLIEQAAPTPASILILGESGTGKELVAQTIHQLSPRAAAPFVAINCAAIPETLLESEIFGHEKGAFTGATALKKGLIEVSAGGTLFLDEVTEMAPSMQVKLLRVLQEKEVLRVGGTKPVKCDVRVLAATNRDVEQAVRDGSFREDLYFRLNVVNLHIPPLAQRRGDIPLLAQHFLLKYAGRMKKPVTRISGEVLAALMEYAFPGNVRELENLIERGTAMAQGDSIEMVHLPEPMQKAGRFSYRKVGARLPTLDEQEREYIRRVLDEVNGNQTAAAQILGINRASLWRKLKARQGGGEPRD